MQEPVPDFCDRFQIFETWFNSTCLVGVNGVLDPVVTGDKKLNIQMISFLCGNHKLFPEY